MTRVRDKVGTKASIRVAIEKLKNSGSSISISAVAKEASIQPSTIHKVYPDEAEEIRVLMGRGVRQQRDRKQAELSAAHATVRELSAKVLQLEKDLGNLASINYSQRHRIERLEAVQRGEIVNIDSKL
jgi:AcrR family transcriptional regulator